MAKYLARWLFAPGVDRGTWSERHISALECALIKDIHRRMALDPVEILAYEVTRVDVEQPDTSDADEGEA